jgi:hypothetical protein
MKQGGLRDNKPERSSCFQVRLTLMVFHTQSPRAVET